MNIDRKTPIGKAVPTEIEPDQEPEVEGHHSFPPPMHDVPKQGDDDQGPEVEGHRRPL